MNFLKSSHIIVIIKIDLASELPIGLVKIQTAGSSSQNFSFSKARVEFKN